MTLKQFISKVDADISVDLGVSVHDLPDIDWYAYYDEDLSDSELEAMVGEAVSDVMYDNGFNSPFPKIELFLESKTFATGKLISNLINKLLDIYHVRC